MRAYVVVGISYAGWYCTIHFRPKSYVDTGLNALGGG